MRRNVIAGCALALSFCLHTQSVAAAEVMHQVPETELHQLEIRLQLQAKTIINCKKDLILLQEQLQNSQALSAKLQEQLSDSRRISQQQSELILNANQSLATFAQEVKRKEKRLTRQRDTAWLVGGLLFLALAAK